VDVILEELEDGKGATVLSRERAKRSESWRALEEAYEEGRKIKVLSLIVSRWIYC